MADYTPTLGYYTELKPFRFWCQKVLPLVYDDSLSYYELLCKVVDYLNKTMEDVDTMHDDVVNLHAAYVQLQTYVNTYFDNLDVQEEINNKLDAMARNGSLSALISPFIPDIVTDWMDEHITPTSPAIDSSLTVSGAGADAKVTGDLIRDNTKNLDDIYYNTANSKNITLESTQNTLPSGLWYNNVIYPKGVIKEIKVTSANSGQCFIALINPTTKIIRRLYKFNGASGANTFTINETIDIDFYLGIAFAGANFNNVAGRTVYRFTGNYVGEGVSVASDATGFTFDFVSNVIYQSTNDRIFYGVSNNLTSEYLAYSTYDGYTNNTSNAWWGNSTRYPAGYIDSLVIKTQLTELPHFVGAMIIDSTTNKVLFKEYRILSTPTVEYVTVPVGLYSDHEFYVLMYGLNKYTSFSAAGALNYYSASAITADINQTFVIPWAGESYYIFPVKIVYKNVSQADLKNNIINKRLFICGDSITAGYPYSMAGDSNAPGLRYGDEIERQLGYKVAFGAQSGNGWLYSTGSANAYSITNDTNFKEYNVALYAWGTNDFYHDMALGDVNDTYASQTICGVINYCINKIYSDNPNIVLIISTPINRTYDNGFGYTKANNAGYTLKDLVDKIIAVCNKHGVFSIDNTISPFNEHTIQGLTVDGLHPNITGYEVLGSYLSAKVGSIIKPYATPFKG